MTKAKNTIEILRIAKPINVRTEGAEGNLKLTKRDEVILNLIIAGLSNRKIADRLGVSISCVRRHKENMLLNNKEKTVIALIARYRNIKTV